MTAPLVALVVAARLASPTETAVGISEHELIVGVARLDLDCTLEH
jgi:hypothetical protein